MDFLEDCFIQLFDHLDVKNDTYFPLRDPETAYLIKEGEVDLFIFDREDLVYEKKGRYITTFHKGDMIFSPSNQLFPCNLFIKTYSTSSVGKIEVKKIKESLDQESSKKFFYQKIVAFSSNIDLFFDHAIDPDFMIVEKNRKLDLKKGESLYFSLQHPLEPNGYELFLKINRGSCNINDENGLKIDPGHRSGVISLFDKITFLEDSEVEFGITYDLLNEFDSNWFNFFFQKTFLKYEKEIKKVDLDKKTTILNELIKEKELLESTSLFLGNVLSADPSASIKYSSDPFIKACQYVADKIGIKISDLLVPSNIEDNDLKLEYLSKKNGFIFRKVKIGRECLTHDFDPLIVFEKTSNQPKVLISKDKKQYCILNPITLQIVPLYDRDFDLFEMEGIVFYKNLDEKPQQVKLFKFIFEKQSRDILVVLIVSFLSGILSLYTPLAYGWIFDKAVPNHANSFLLQILLGLFIVSVSNSLFQLVRAYALLRLEGKTSNKLQNAIWNRLIRMKLTFFKKFGAGDLFQRISAIDQIRSLISNHLLTTAVGSFFSFLYFGVMLYHSVVLSFIMLIPILSMIILFVIVIYMTIPRELKVLNLQGEIYSFFVPIIDNIRKLRIYNAETRAYQKWAFLFSSKKKQEIEIMAIHNWLMVIHQFIQNSGTMIMYLVVIGYLVKQSNNKLPSSVHMTSIGQFLSFSSAYGAFVGAVFSVGGSFLSLLKDVVPRFQRTKVVFDDEIEPQIFKKSNIKRFQGEVVFNQTRFRYDKDSRIILNNINIKVFPGSVIQVVGTSGSGKTTLVRLLTGELNTTEGSIFIDGLNIQEYSLSYIRHELGALRQESAIFMGSLKENLTCGRNFSDERMSDVLEICGMSDIVDNLPMGLETVLPSGGSTLTDEEKRKIFLCRVLLTDPSIIIVDDALISFSVEERAKIIEYFKSRHKTLIVLSRKILNPHLFDHTYSLINGVIESYPTK